MAAMTHDTEETGWGFTPGLGYGQPSWVEIHDSATGAYVIVDMATMEVMEDGLQDEDGYDVKIPATIADQLYLMAADWS